MYENIVFVLADTIVGVKTEILFFDTMDGDVVVNHAQRNVSTFAGIVCLINQVVYLIFERLTGNPKDLTLSGGFEEQWAWLECI